MNNPISVKYASLYLDIIVVEGYKMISKVIKNNVKGTVLSRPKKLPYNYVAYLPAGSIGEHCSERITNKPIKAYGVNEELIVSGVIVDVRREITGDVIYIA